MDWWKRLSSQEKLLIGVGAPAVALIALVSILRRPEPVEEDDPPAAPIGLDGPYLTPAGDMGLVGQLSGFEDRISESIMALIDSINGANPDEDVPPGFIPSPTQPGTPIPTPLPQQPTSPWRPVVYPVTIQEQHADRVASFGPVPTISPTSPTTDRTSSWGVVSYF